MVSNNDSKPETQTTRGGLSIVGLLVFLSCLSLCVLQAQRGWRQWQQWQHRQATQPWHDKLGANDWGKEFELQGYWRPDKLIFLDNRQQQGKTGIELLAPLQIHGKNDWLAVNLGWQEKPPQSLPHINLPAGLVHLRVRLADPNERYLRLGNEDFSQRLWPFLDWPRYQTWVENPLYPVLALALNGNDVLRRHWPDTANKALMHASYSGQWLLLALLTLYLYLKYRRKLLLL